MEGKGEYKANRGGNDRTVSMEERETEAFFPRIFFFPFILAAIYSYALLKISFSEEKVVNVFGERGEPY